MIAFHSSHTCSLLPSLKKFRRSIKALGYHGFLPKNTTSTAQNAVEGQGDNMRNYHMELEAVLTTFLELGPAHIKGSSSPLAPRVPYVWILSHVYCSSFKICRKVTRYVVAMDHMILQFTVILDLATSVSKTLGAGRQTSAHICLLLICTRFPRVIRQLKLDGPNIRSTMLSAVLCLQTQCVEYLMPLQLKLCIHSVKVFLSM
jgi:hypothetical protein